MISRLKMRSALIFRVLIVTRTTISRLYVPIWKTSTRASPGSRWVFVDLNLGKALYAFPFFSMYPLLGVFICLFLWSYDLSCISSNKLGIEYFILCLVGGKKGFLWCVCWCAVCGGFFYGVTKRRRGERRGGGRVGCGGGGWVEVG